LAWLLAGSSLLMVVAAPSAAALALEVGTSVAAILVAVGVWANSL
jgi:hypothetical protein